MSHVAPNTQVSVFFILRRGGVGVISHVSCYSETWHCVSFKLFQKVMDFHRKTAAMKYSKRGCLQDISLQSRRMQNVPSGKYCHVKDPDSHMIG